MASPAQRLMAGVGVVFTGSYLANNMETLGSATGALARNLLYSLSKAPPPPSSGGGDAQIAALTAVVAQLAASLARGSQQPSGRGWLVAAGCVATAATFQLRGFELRDVLPVSRRAFKAGVSTLGGGVSALSAALAAVRATLVAKLDVLTGRVDAGLAAQAEIAASLEARQGALVTLCLYRF